MRIIAIVLNVLLLVTFLYFLITDGVPRGSQGHLLLALFLATPISSLLALFFNKETWIGLFLKRKALEEKKKIERLKVE